MGAPKKRLTTILSTKGQVILPKAIRDQRHWAAGTRLSVEDTVEGVVLRPAPSFTPAAIDEVFGILRHDGHPLSLKDMKAAVEAEAARRAWD